MVVLTLLIGIAVGAAAVWLVLRAQLGAARAAVDVERRATEEKVALVERSREELETSFKALCADALRSNNESFVTLARGHLEQLQQKAQADLQQSRTAVEQLVTPIRESLERVGNEVKTLEQARRQAYGALTQQLQTLADGQERLRSATGNLVTALRAPHVRGRWGEVQLKRVVEATGMLEHCDFVLQATTRDGEGGLLRPDLIVRLPGNKQVVVDAKVPLAAYLDACECEDDLVRARQLGEHARQVREHVTKLAAKAYWRQFEPAPDFVVMFLPDETFLRAAQEHDSSIGEYAWGSNVIPASPTNLFTLLRTIAAIWQQETVASSAREVHALGQELYERLATMGGHVSQLGRSLASAVGHYNKTVATFETRVLVTARKLEAHGIPAALPDVEAVEATPRPLTAPELVEAADAAPRALDAA